MNYNEQNRAAEYDEDKRTRAHLIAIGALRPYVAPVEGFGSRLNASLALDSTELFRAGFVHAARRDFGFLG